MTYNPKELSEKGEKFRLNLRGIDFAFEKRLYAKLATMCKRVTQENPKLDACLSNEGYEGEGKTNASLIEAIVALSLMEGTYKDASISLFFKTSSCIKFAQNTNNQIIILDEPSIESLSTDHGNKLNKDFLRLISTMRKKRHFLIINFAKFWKFPEFLVVDRALGMVCLYSKQGKYPGKFMYIRKKNLEKLWNGKKKSNKMLHRKLKSFRGRFPYLMEEIFEKFSIRVEEKEDATFEDYDKEKDNAIESIGETKLSKREEGYKRKLGELQLKVSTLWRNIPITQVKLASHLQISPVRLREWANRVDGGV